MHVCKLYVVFVFKWVYGMPSLKGFWVVIEEPGQSSMAMHVLIEHGHICLSQSE